MSSFSSVVQKPGQKIAPRAPPRRAARKPLPNNSSDPVVIRDQSETPSIVAQNADVPGSAEIRGSEPLQVLTTSDRTEHAAVTHNQDEASEDNRQDEPVWAAKDAAPIPQLDRENTAQSALSRSVNKDVSDTQEPPSLACTNLYTDVEAMSRPVVALETSSQNMRSSRSPAAQNSSAASSFFPAGTSTEQNSASSPARKRKILESKSEAVSSRGTEDLQVVKSRPVAKRRKAVPRAQKQIASTPAPALAEQLPENILDEPIQVLARGIRSTRAASQAASEPGHRSDVDQGVSRASSGFERLQNLSAQIGNRASQLPTPQSIDDQLGSSVEASKITKKRKNKGIVHVCTPQADLSVEELAARINADLSRGQNKERESTVSSRVPGKQHVRTTGETEKRQLTPDDAEDHIIETSMSMAELASKKYNRIGKKSETEKEMAQNWDEILRRRREAADTRAAAQENGRRRRGGKASDDTPIHYDDAQIGPQMSTDAEGNIVISADSRTHNRNRAAEEAAQGVDQGEQFVYEDKDIYKRVNQSTVGNKPRVAPGQFWDEVSTGLFYNGLRTFGTDFMMISNMIPGKNRRQVKLKYNVEERANWARVQRALNKQELDQVDLTAYAERAGLQLQTASDIYKQMEDDEIQIREEEAQRRREAGIIPTLDAGADNALPSIEGTESVAHAITADGTALDLPATNRFGSTTTRGTAQPATKSKSKKKSNQNNKKAKERAMFGETNAGTEEALGSVDDIGVPLNG